MVDAVVGALIGGAATLGAVFLSYLLRRRHMSDKEQFYEWLIMFDRPAWRGSFVYRSYPFEPFIQAIDDTILALDTGKFVSRGGKDLPHGALGVAQLRNPARRREMHEVLDHLRRIRDIARELPPPPADNETTKLVDLMDEERDGVIDTMNRLWADLGIEGVRRPSEIRDYQADLT